jgi:oxygen-independent coproporphyrinogen-3 oxidase
LQRLFALLEKYLLPRKNCEITVECNPETLDQEKVSVLRGFAGRISLGVQSFDASLRNRLGRKCSDGAIRNAFGLIAAAGFKHWNCDLIYAIPGQSRKDFEKDLMLAAESGVDHISCYALTPEEGAALAPSFEIDEDIAADCWISAGRSLKAKGFYRYEVSNYALRGGECRHNLAVWRGGLLRGFGPSAAGFDGVNRCKELASLQKWLDGEDAAIDEISAAERLNEIFAVNLRTSSGWTPGRWQKVPGADAWEYRLSAAMDAVKKTRRDFWRISPDKIALTTKGLLFWDSVAEALLI